MRLRLTSTNWDTDRLLKYYPFVNDFNLEDPQKDTSFEWEWEKKYRPVYITVNTLEELNDFLDKIVNCTNKSCSEVVLGKDNTEPIYGYIEIYDGYRE